MGTSPASTPSITPGTCAATTTTAANMVKYEGDYKLDLAQCSKNFDEFMQALGVGLVTRKAMANVSPTLTITVAGDHWTIKQATTFRTFVQEFDIGKAQDTTTSDGRKVKSTVTKSGDTLTEKQVGGDGKDVTFIRTFQDDGIKMICECNGVKCDRFCKRQ